MNTRLAARPWKLLRICFGPGRVLEGQPAQNRLVIGGRFAAPGNGIENAVGSHLVVSRYIKPARYLARVPRDSRLCFSSPAMAVSTGRRLRSESLPCVTLPARRSDDTAGILPLLAIHSCDDASDHFTKIAY